MRTEQRRQTYETPWQRVTEAAIAYADADPEDNAAFERARKRLDEAGKAYWGKRKQ